MRVHFVSLLAVVDKSSDSYRVGQVAAVIVLALLVFAATSRYRKRRG